MSEAAGGTAAGAGGTAAGAGEGSGTAAAANAGTAAAAAAGTGSSASQAGAQQGSANAGAASSSGAGQDSGQRASFDAEYVRSLRDEAATNRIAARDAATKLEQEQARATEATQRAEKIERERVIEKAGVVDAEAALRLLGDDAKVKLEELPAKLEALLVKYPFLKGQQDTNAAAAARNSQTDLQKLDDEFAATGRKGLRL